MAKASALRGDATDVLGQRSLADAVLSSIINHTGKHAGFS
jgi:hypothetical protein